MGQEVSNLDPVTHADACVRGKEGPFVGKVFSGGFKMGAVQSAQGVAMLTVGMGVMISGQSAGDGVSSGTCSPRWRGRHVHTVEG